MLLRRSTRPPPLSPDQARAAVAQLHAEVDATVAPVAAHHGARLTCGRGCHACCQDDLTVFEVEADLLRDRHGALFAQEAPHPAGGCALLDADGACRVYADRPYVCRTQGLPLQWEGDRGERLRDICPLNLPGPALEDLPEEACFTLGPFEARLAALQAQQDGGRLRRVALRSLFQGGAGR